MRCDKWDRFGRRLIGHRYLLMDPIFCAEKPDAGRRNFWGWKSEKSFLVIEKVERGPQWLVFDQDLQECVYVKGRDESSQVCNQCPSPQHERQPWGRKSIWRRESTAQNHHYYHGLLYWLGVRPYTSAALMHMPILSQSFCYVTRAIQERGQSRSNLSIAHRALGTLLVHNALRVLYFLLRRIYLCFNLWCRNMLIVCRVERAPQQNRQRSLHRMKRTTSSGNLTHAALYPCARVHFLLLVFYFYLR